MGGGKGDRGGGGEKITDESVNERTKGRVARSISQSTHQSVATGPRQPAAVSLKDHEVKVLLLLVGNSSLLEEGGSTSQVPQAAVELAGYGSVVCSDSLPE